MNNKSTITLAAALLLAAINNTAAQDIKPPAGEIPLMTVAAHGVQIYECRAASGESPAWTFVAPEADLFDTEGQRIGKHGAGPFWQHEDGSRFTGTLRAKADAPQPRAIPWLLLSARAQGPEGKFSRVSSVQRLNTADGQAPANGCDSTALGKRAQMRYRADYVLFVPQR